MVQLSQPGQAEEMRLEEIERIIDREGIELVRFEIPDLNGVSRGKSIAAKHFRRYVEGGLSLVSDVYCWDHECWVAEGTGFGEDMTFADLVMKPDLGTFRVLPHVEGQARVICDMYHSDGSPVEAAPRYVLQRLVEQAADRGLTPLLQAEYEFYLLDAATLQPPFGGTDITTTLTNQRLPVLRRMMRTMPALGLEPNTLNQEWGPTQYELNFDPAIGVMAGDQCFTYKTYAKEMAEQDDLVLSFMTKPFRLTSGSSCHLHMSLFDEHGSNVYSDQTAPNGVSDQFLWSIGGQLAHGRGLSLLFGPTVNCRKRYRRNTYAPASLTWGFENRSVAVRVKAWRGDNTHIENRGGSGSCNPYLAFAGVLAASLAGIDGRIDPGEPRTTSAYRDEGLEPPAMMLEDALDDFIKDEELVSYFPEPFVKAFAALKRHEIDKAREASVDYGSDAWHADVTDWEREQFLRYA